MKVFLYFLNCLVVESRKFVIPYQIGKGSPLVLLGFLILSGFCFTENAKAQSVNFNRSITTSSDDAEENISTTAVVLNSTDLEIGLDGSAAQIIGLRFPNITIPKNAVITNAYVEFETDVAWSNSTGTIIHGQNDNDALTFTTTNANISVRPKTSASIVWNPVAWNTLDEKQNSPDIKNIIQEIVNRSGWVSGNAMAILITGSSGTREAESWDGESTAAPKLYITYTNPEICDNNIDDDGDGLTDCNDPDCYKLLNREFDQSFTFWDFYFQGGASATRTVDNTSQLSGINSAQFNISISTGTNWHVQFAQPNVSLEAGKTYEISFRAKASANRTINAFTDFGADPWTTYFSQDVNITTTAQTFTYTYTQSENRATARFGFNLGQSTQTVWIDNVVLREICVTPLPIPGCGWLISDHGPHGTMGGSPKIWYVPSTGGTSNTSAPPSGMQIWSNAVQEPMGIAKHGNYFYVTDYGQGNITTNRATVVELNPNGTATGKRWHLGSATPLVPYGWDILSNANYLYIGVYNAPTQNGMGVYRIDPSTYAIGNHYISTPWSALRPWGNGPQGLAVGRGAQSGNILASVVINNAQSAVYAIPLSTGTVPATPLITESTTHPDGPWLGGIRDIDTDESGNIYVAQASDDKLHKYSATGTLLENNWMIIGGGASTYPTGHAWGSDGNQYFVSYQTGDVWKHANIPGSQTKWLDWMGKDTYPVMFAPKFMVEVGNCCPSVTSTNPSSRCGTGTVTLGATASSGTLNWYAALTGGSSLGTGTSFTTPSISSTTTYYVEVTANGCTSPSRTAVVASVNSCTGFSCGSQSCETPNQILNDNFNVDLSNWTATNGELSVGTGGPFGNFLVLNNSDLIGDYSVYQDVTFAANASYKFTGLAAKHGSGSNSKVYLEFYNGTTFISKTFDFMVTHNYDNTFQTITPFEGITPASTTKIRVVGYCNGTALKIENFALIGCAPITANAGSDISQCGNNVFPISGNTPGAGQSGLWTVVSGTATIANASSPTTTATITSGNTASLRWTVTGPGVTTQTTHIGSTTDGGFENGTTFSANGWTAVNNGTNAWYVGNAATPSSGNRSAYISDNGGTNYTYTITSPQTSHFYKDITIPGGNTDLTLTFKWKAQGESGYDRILVYTAPTSVTPVAGTPVSPATAISGATLVSDLTMHSQPGYQNYSITLPNSLAGTTFRLIFTWQNDNSVGGQPPASLDEITLTSNGAGTCSVTDDIVLTLQSVPTATISGSNNICTGGSSIFTASGGNTYLWSTAATTPAITVSNAGTYVVTVTNTSGCTSSASRVLTVNTDPSISTHPVGNTICSGGTHSMSVVATGGTPSLTYQWQSSPDGTTWTNISGAVSTSYTTPVLTTTTRYRVIVSASGSGCESINSNSAIVSVVADPSITTHPASATICSGGNRSLTIIAAGGTPSLTYQWQSSPDGTTWTNISGATFSNYTTPVLTTTTHYRVNVGASGTDCNTISSNPAIISVVAQHIATINGNQTICAGGTAAFTATVSGGSGTITYQWQDSPDGSAWTNISGATSASFTTPTLTASTYFRVVVSRSASNCGSVNSTSSLVTVVADPTISTHPADATICSGGSISLSVIATGGTPSLTYQWESSLDGTTWTPVSGATNSTYTSGSLVTTTRYRVVVSATGNGCGSITTNPAIITVVSQHTASITANQSICNGGTATLTATVSGGTGTTSYFWQNSPDGSTWNNISGATSVSYTTPALSVTTHYRVNVTRAGVNCGNVNSPASIVTVVNDPAISTHPQSATICSGATSTLTVTGSGGTPSLTYQWQSSPDGSTWSNISGAVSATYTTPSLVSLTHYKVIVGATGNGCTNVTSNTAIISIDNVNSPVVGIITQPTCSTPTGSVVLSGLPASGTWTITRTPGGTTYTGSGTSYTVTGLPVNTTYTFTVTNSLSCTSPASTNAVINAIPGAPVLGGASSVCVGATANVTPNSLGTWSSSNTAISTVTNAGVVSGISSGSVVLTYTRTSDGCSNTLPITVYSIPGTPVTGTVTQPTCSTPTGSVILSGLPSSGTWTITATPGGATYTSTGTTYTVSGLAVNTTYTFVVANSNNCSSSNSAGVTINSVPGAPVTGGPASVCVGNTANVTPSSNGTWTSSNNSVATITNAGLVSSVSAGTVTLTYTRSSDGCSASHLFTVFSNPSTPVVGTITQPSCSTPTGSVTLSGLPSSGNWTITRTPGSITYTGSGTTYTVNNLPPNTTYTFCVMSSNNCNSPSTNDAVINAIPGAPVLGGPSSACIGSTANVTPNSGGIWTSDNNSIATITNAGLVSAVTAGSVTLTYTRSSDGCSNTLPFTVNANPSAPITGTVTQPTCLVPTGSVVLSVLPSSGTWTITRTPGGNTYSGSGTSYTVSGLPVNTTYSFTVTNLNNCTSLSSGNVTINSVPGAPVLGGPSEICLGLTANVTPSTNGTWASSNNTIATITNSGLVTSLAVGTINLIYTRTSDGCSNSKPFTVYANPTTPSVGIVNQPSCSLPTGSVVLNGLPSSGSWTITRTPGGTTYSGSGTSYTVTGLPANSTYTFTVTNANICTSPSSGNVVINAIPNLPVTGGASSVCVGSTANITPSTNGTWASNNNSIATVSNVGLVTGIAAGTVTLTYTRTSDGCSNTLPFTVNSNPSTPVTGSITQPTCAVPSGSVVLNNLPASGTWTITRTPGAATYTGTGTSYTVTGLPANTNYTFTATNSIGCTSASGSTVAINGVPGAPVLSGPASACVGLTANVSPSSNGTWASSNNSIANVSNSGLVTAIAPGSVTLTYTRTSDGCSNTLPFTVYAYPSIPAIGTITQPNCPVPTGSVVLNGLPSTGTWTITQSPGGNTYTGTGTSYTITGLAHNTTYTFVVANQQNCVSASSNNVVINGLPTPPSVNIDYMGSICVETNKQISANVTGGTPPLTYNWTGPSGFTGNTQTVNITLNGNYYLTVTDANLCTAVTSGFLYERYEPFIVSLQTNICEGTSITLDVNSTSAISYLWGPNAGNATTKIVTVTPVVPASTYLVTVTNDIGCTAVPSITINVNPKPVVSVTGPSTICVGSTTTLSPTTGGTWASSNPSVASVSNSGVVTGISQGTATFVFTSSITNCPSNATTAITINAKPTVSITGPSNICIGSTTTLSPTTGGTWTSSNPSVATVTNGGIVTGVATGSATFTFTNSTTLCASNATASISVSAAPNLSVSGPDFVCESSNISLTASLPGGTWSSSNTLVATVSNTGIVTGISDGTVNITYTHVSGSCTSIISKSITVLDKPVITLTGTNTICAGQTTTFAPSTGGTWTSSNPGVASINSSGVVLGINAGIATFTFQNGSTGCYSNPSQNITVYPRPVITLTGPSNICVGNTTNILPSSGGTWTSSNSAIATINSNGLITGVSAGIVTFNYTDNGSGCISNASAPINVGPVMTAALDYHGSVCLTDNSQITALPNGGTPNYTYQWVGPLGFTTNTATINLTLNGNYYVTVTDSYGCKANVSGFIHQRFEPVIVNLGNGVCQGQSINLSVNATNAVHYQWGSNASNSTSSSVTVFPMPPSTAYFVTVTNNLGCQAVANANIIAHPKIIPVITGSNPVCVGQTSSISPSSGGTWVSLNPTIASVSNSGLITALSQGFARFIFTNSTTNCASDTSSALTVLGITPTSFAGPSTICKGSQTQVNPSSGGTWISLNPSVATITNSGLVTGVSAGAAALKFTNANGCVTTANLMVSVQDIPSIVLDGPNQICPSTNTQFLPSVGGTWVSSNPAVATITNSGLVSGITQGTARFVFTNTFSGCSSDSSVVITVLSASIVSVTGPNPICVGGSTTLSPYSGGVWVSNNPSVASVNNGGIVMGISQGQVTFTFTSASGGCPSLPTTPITVNPRPSISLSGPSGICIGGNTNMLPATGGTWSSSDIAKATITNAGLVTGISSGSVNFIFTQTSTGCISLPSTNITIYPKPIVSIANLAICVGNTTQLTPSIGGTWASSNPAVASVNGSGVVTGISEGGVFFTFTENMTGCISNPTAVLTVSPKPVVSVTGNNNICVGQTTQLSPAGGGSWSSMNPSVASVDNNGVVTGLSNGSVQFTFTTPQGCVSNPSQVVTVNGKPVIAITGPSPICIGTTTQLSPISGGTWSSSNTSVASVNNAGLVTGLAAGTTRFVFTNTSTGCSSDSSAVLLVNGTPNISLIGPGNICIGQSSQLSPTVGGTWLSLQPTIATVSNTGLVTGISSGTASFVFTEASSGCQATLNNAITVLSRPLVSVTGPNPICIGNTTTLSPSVGGTWLSTNPAVATVNSGGIVTGITSGISTFIFTNSSNGCSSLPTTPITVSGKPNTLLQGSPTICIGNTTQFTPTTGGTWTSSNPLVATINNQGLVTGVALGTATFTFTDLSTGCISDPSSPVTVQSPAVLEITGPNVICLGYTTTLSATSSGIWYSTHPSVASVSSIGVVTGKAPGKVSFYFEETGSGCISYLPADAISVVNCIDPDFNATLVNITLNGNLKTNDEIPNGSTYLNNPFLVSKPLGSAASLEINPSGSYTFTASMEGVYEYNIQVCLPGMISNCPVSNLVITVVNSYIEKQNIIPNLDIISTFENTAIIIKSIYNDKCVAEDECLSDPSRMNIISQPKNGTATLLPNGDITYTPNNNFVGQDTLEYRLCSSIDPANCRLAKQIITVMAGNAINTLVATDDFYAIMKGSILTNTNIIINDFDPEDTHFSILPQGSLSNPIMISSGSYYITSAGGLFFTPNPRFIGPVDIVYTICDNQNFCISATVHILVVDHMLIRSRVYLEGALLENGDARSSTSRPLMRDNLRVSPYTGLNYIPVRDPYSFASSFSDISTNYTHERAGLMPQYQTIQDSAAVFGVTGENAIVDWVFMELRDKNDYTRLLATRSALVQRDGDVVDLDGVNPVEFPGTKVDSCYIVLRHRNHFGVMSLKVATIDLTDFTLPTTPTFDYGTSLNNGYNYVNLAQKSDVILDYLALWAGDFDGNGKIKFVNPDDDQNVLFIEVLTYPTNTEYTANYNYAYGYLQGDYNLNAKSKYDNPDDDKNMLFYQTLFHPLNTNYISNFNFIIQQVPAIQSR